MGANEGDPNPKKVASCETVGYVEIFQDKKQTSKSRKKILINI